MDAQTENLKKVLKDAICCRHPVLFHLVMC